VTESSDVTAVHELVVEPDQSGVRLDAYLADRFPQYSRTHLRRIIGRGRVLVDGQPTKAAQRLHEHQHVRIGLPPLPQEGPQPEDIPLEILYEDECLIAVNKPSAMVVHPAKGHWSGTLTAALAFHFQQLSQVGGSTRPGIVHRLDRDTSGVIVVAKTDQVHLQLASQFEARTTRKEYFVIVKGRCDHDRDVIEAPIGRHPYQREKMAIRAQHVTSRPARTRYEVAERFAGWTALRVFPETGRTHQIRVHLAHIGYPVLCDRLYGGRAQITRRELLVRGQDETVILNRQALHAHRLTLLHPVTHEPIELVAPLPKDLEDVLMVLREAHQCT
jgi:23S rRNA pseudouridine1911/1915/1917 synthase